MAPDTIEIYYEYFEIPTLDILSNLLMLLMNIVDRID